MRRLLFVLVALGFGACRPDPVARPPQAEFLVVAGDSTFWVHAEAQALRARGSPIQLARYGGRFYEIYIADDDRSYANAELVGQQVWRRDLISGDSALVFKDTTIAGIERWYARTHPDDRPLDPDEDMADDPNVSATSEFDILDQFGPYLSYEYRADMTVTGGDEWHIARHGVLDLRHGGDAALASLFGARDARYLVRRGASLFSVVLDSVLASRDARARQAAATMGDFGFDSTSFGVTALGRAPAVEFATPGRGIRGGGLVLPLPPIKVTAPSWWGEVQALLPEHSDSGGADGVGVDRWTHGRNQVVARQGSDDDDARLAVVDSAGRTWPVASVPTPVRRVYWLYRASADSITIRALARAFDEAALYSDDARTAMLRRPRSGIFAGPRVRPVRGHVLSPHSNRST
jgi:hypothetical protein